MDDPRIHLVEENLLSQFEILADSGHVTRLPDEDVVAFHRDLPFPLFNAISGARFAPGTAGERTRELVAGYLERGNGLLWWATPSTMPPEADVALRSLGIHPSPEPGMHRTMAGEVDSGRTPPGLAIVETEVDEVLADVLAEGFGFPAFVVEPMRAAMASISSGVLFHVLATLDGRPVGGGSGFLSGPDRRTLGIYNITTLDSARRQGIGRAVTAELMRLGRERGCTDAVLMASQLGRPTYERLGFVEVCQTPQYVWAPST